MDSYTVYSAEECEILGALHIRWDKPTKNGRDALETINSWKANPNEFRYFMENKIAEQIEVLKESGPISNSVEMQLLSLTKLSLFDKYDGLMNHDICYFLIKYFCERFGMDTFCDGPEEGSKMHYKLHYCIDQNYEENNQSPKEENNTRRHEWRHNLIDQIVEILNEHGSLSNRGIWDLVKKEWDDIKLDGVPQPYMLKFPERSYCAKSFTLDIPNKDSREKSFKAFEKICVEARKGWRDKKQLH